MSAPPSGHGTLPRAGRLRVPAEFDRLFRRGVRVERRSFVLLWVAAPGRRAAAFVAGRRLGGSVLRNRARRRLREAYRRQQHLLRDSGYRLCFVARQPVLREPFTQLVSDVSAALRLVGQTTRGRGVEA